MAPCRKLTLKRLKSPTKTRNKIKEKYKEMSVFEFNYFPKGTVTGVPAPAPPDRPLRDAGVGLNFDYTTYISKVQIAKPLPRTDLRSNVSSLMVDFTANKTFDRTTIYYYIKGVKQLNTMRNRLIDALHLTLNQTEAPLTWLDICSAEDKKDILALLTLHQKRTETDVLLKAIAPAERPARPTSYYTNINDFSMPAPSSTFIPAKTCFTYDYKQVKRNLDIAAPTPEPTRSVPEIMTFAYDAKPPDLDNPGFQQYLRLYHLLIAEVHILQDKIIRVALMKQKCLECITLSNQLLADIAVADARDGMEALEAVEAVEAVEAFLVNHNIYLDLIANYISQQDSPYKTLALDRINVFVQKNAFLGDDALEAAALKAMEKDIQTAHAYQAYRIAKMKNVPANGACFYYAIYGALAAANLLVPVCQAYQLREVQEDFITDLKGYLLHQTDLLLDYGKLFGIIWHYKYGPLIFPASADAQAEFIRKYGLDRYRRKLNRELTRNLPMSTLEILKRYTKGTEGAEGVEAKKAFLEAIKTAFVEPAYWASEIETRYVIKLLAQLVPSISVIILFPESADLAKKRHNFVCLVEQPNNIYLFSDDVHFQYFAFLPSLPSSALKRDLF
jgi:hypothetical protein